MTWTDITVFIVLTTLIAIGAHQGFLRSLVSPFSFVIGSAFGYFVFFFTRNIFAGLAMALVLPFLLTWGLNTLLGELPTQILFLSRIGGATVNFFLGGAILAFGLLSLALLPIQNPELDALHKDINASKSYPLLEKMAFGKKKIVPLSADCPTSTCGMSTADVQALMVDEDIQQLVNDERVRKIADDPAIRQAIKTKNMSQLLSNEAIKDLLQDPQLLIRIFKAYPKVRAKMVR